MLKGFLTDLIKNNIISNFIHVAVLAVIYQSGFVVISIIIENIFGGMMLNSLQTVDII